MIATASWIEVGRLAGGMLVVLLSVLLVRSFVVDYVHFRRDGARDRLVGWWIVGAIRLKAVIAVLGGIEAYSGYSSAVTPAGVLPVNSTTVGLLRLLGLVVLVLVSVDRYAMRQHFERYAVRRDRRATDRTMAEIQSHERPPRDPRDSLS